MCMCKSMHYYCVGVGACIQSDEPWIDDIEASVVAAEQDHTLVHYVVLVNWFSGMCVNVSACVDVCV